MSILPILLINSNRYHDPAPVMPIGLCSVAAALEDAGFPVRVLDLCFSANPAEAIKQAVEEFRPGLVGVSIRNIDTCNGFQPHFLIDAVASDVIIPLKMVYSGPIVLGGAAVAINPEELLAYLDVEYAVRGDGEAAMLDLASCLSAGRMAMQSCRGLVRRQEGRIIQANPPAFATDLNSLPSPQIDRFIDISQYRQYGSPLTVQTKRGCALNCSYCTYNQIEGQSWRLRNPVLIADEICDYVQRTGYRRFEFVDSTFNLPLEHAKAILRELVSRDLDLSLSTMGLNPRFIDAEFMGLLRQTGFQEISLGVEAGCDLTLAGLGKNFSVRDIENVGPLVRKSGIPAMWYLLLGGPGETEATAMESIRTIGRLASPLDVVNIGIGLRAYRGSPVSRDMLASNCVHPEDNFLHPVAYRPSGLDIPRLKFLAARACSRRHNLLMFDDGANIPPWFSRFFAWAFPHQPIWRAYVVGRWLCYFNGIWLIQNLMFFILARSLRQRYSLGFAPSKAPGQAY